MAIVALDGEDRVLLVRQTRAGAGGPTVELPAGCLEPGETPLAAAVRELREECSTAAADWRALGSFWVVPAYSTERVHVFAAHGLTADPGVADPDEDIVVELRPVAELPAGLSDATSIAAFALWAASTAPREGLH